jgi:hypothetical protein
MVRQATNVHDGAFEAEAEAPGEAFDAGRE